MRFCPECAASVTNTHHCDKCSHSFNRYSMSDDEPSYPQRLSTPSVNQSSSVISSTRGLTPGPRVESLNNNFQKNRSALNLNGAKATGRNPTNIPVWSAQNSKQSTVIALYIL
jgi:hypothetical protein